VPALSSSLITPALEQLAGLHACDRERLGGGCASLAGHLARVPDPRDRRGVRHSLTSLLLTAVAAVLAGRGRLPRSVSGPRTRRPRSWARSGSAVIRWRAGSSLRARRPSAGCWKLLTLMRSTPRWDLGLTGGCALLAGRPRTAAAGGRWPWTARRCGHPPCQQ
jgi:DDE_Tnp_1-associated